MDTQAAMICEESRHNPTKMTSRRWNDGHRHFFLAPGRFGLDGASATATTNSSSLSLLLFARRQRRGVLDGNIQYHVDYRVTL
jgi:hypothetical protein